MNLSRKKVAYWLKVAEFSKAVHSTSCSIPADMFTSSAVNYLKGRLIQVEERKKKKKKKKRHSILPQKTREFDCFSDIPKMFYLHFVALALAVEILPAAGGVPDIWGHRHQAQGPISAVGDCQATTTNAKTNDFAVTPDDIARANRDGFFFENPETDCKYVSQPYIYKAFKTLETDLSRLFTLIYKDVDFQVVGHHAIAGRYHDLMHFYVNALRRVAVAGSEHLDAFRVNPMGIHGGCDEEWSVQEMNFKGLSNSGKRQVSFTSLLIPFFILSPTSHSRRTNKKTETKPLFANRPAI